MDINSYIADLPSVEAATFDEYAQLMKIYILAAKKSDSFEGTKRLLTELYPDNAHFIYELLQNAEDAEAEQVYFELMQDRLIFRHDGKREFTLKDVKGITNIGNSTKKDDHTKVGKFGVGFKSVFAFTDKPQVYSNQYNFEIQDMLMPVKIEASSKRKNRETLFVFPFKGDIKEQRKHLLQIEKELKSLDENTIMFLDNICQISYVTSDGINGYVKRKRVEENRYDIEVSSQRRTSSWLIFNKGIRTTSNNKKSKLHVNISFAVKEQSGKLTVTPVPGTVNIFFPAVKENSGLRFNINGPFASTVARDSIRECEENIEIFNSLADLLVEALLFMKKNNMISMNLYELLPNNEDPLEKSYSIIREKTLDAFKNHALLLSATGECYKSTELVKTIPSIQNVFSFLEIKKLMKYDEMDWCCTVPVRNKNCRAFFESLNMRSYTYRMLSKLFDDDHRNEFEELLQGKGMSWYRNLYLLLIDLHNSYQEGRMVAQYPTVHKNIRKSKIIYSAANSLQTPADIYRSIGITPEGLDIFVNERLLSFKELDSFWIIFGIKEYDDKATAKILLSRIEGYQSPCKEYYSDLLQLARKAEYIDVANIIDSKIWFAESKSDRYKAENLYLDLPYEETGYSNIACVIGHIYELSCDYKVFYSASELSEVIGFAKKLGIASGITIVKSDVKKNPLYHESLYRYSDNVTALSTSEDYSIICLEDLLNSQNYAVSKLLWNYMIDLQTLPRYCKASFSPNRTTQPRKCDSSLILLFREKEWVPNIVDGKFYKPADISKEFLPDDFVWEDNSIFTNLIMFATNKNKVLLQSEKLISDWGVDAESEQAQALRALLSNPQMAGRILTLVNKEEKQQYNLTQAIEAQSRKSLEYEEDFDDSEMSIRNVERRKRKLQEELEEGLKKPTALKKLGIVSRTKTTPEERIFLFEQYHGKCQICGQTIKKWNGKNYFEGINLIATKTLSEQYKKSLETGWNSLCLCPNHAAIYKYGAVDLSDLQENILSIEVANRNNDCVKLPIVMQDAISEIKYTPKHFLALKAAFEFFVAIENE